MSSVNEFAFFPGCVLSQAAKESKMSLEAIAPILGIKLHEIEGWSCCGASQAQNVDPLATLVANARNIALAEGMNMPLLTTCSTCMLTLTRAKRIFSRRKYAVSRQHRDNELALGSLSKRRNS